MTYLLIKVSNEIAYFCETGPSKAILARGIRALFTKLLDGQDYFVRMSHSKYIVRPILVSHRSSSYFLILVGVHVRAPMCNSAAAPR